MSQADATPPQDTPEQPLEGFMSHLIELRNRLMKAIVAVLGVFVIIFTYPGAAVIYDFLAQPMLASLPHGTRMIATGVITPFMVPLKVTLLAAFLLALPYVLYQAWAFVAPGLYRHEQKLAVPLIVSSSLLFLAGMAFCYFVVFKTVFAFIQSFAPQSITPAPDIEAYLNFVMTMFIAFGITFEVPIVVVVLVRMGIMTVQKLRDIRGYVIVLAFVIAAIVTPPDVISQFMLALPLWILYEVGLILARYVKPRQAEDESEADDSTDDTR